MSRRNPQIQNEHEQDRDSQSETWVVQVYDSAPSQTIREARPGGDGRDRAALARGRRTAADKEYRAPGGKPEATQRRVRRRQFRDRRRR